MPALSIVTVCYNSAATIRETLDSVAAQTFKDFEYIIIDGGSNDATLDIIKSYRSLISHLVSEKDQGIYDAMNKGISLAQGDWIHLLNSDDYYYNANALASTVPLLEDQHRFYYFTMFQRYGEKLVPYRWSSGLWKLWYSAYIPHPTMLVSRKAYQELGTYSLDFPIAADHDMTLRLIQSNYKPIYNDIPFSVMRMGGFSGQSYQKTFLDHKKVTIHNGFPRPLAQLYYLIKTNRKRFLA